MYQGICTKYNIVLYYKLVLLNLSLTSFQTKIKGCVNTFKFIFDFIPNKNISFCNLLIHKFILDTLNLMEKERNGCNFF